MTTIDQASPNALRAPSDMNGLGFGEQFLVWAIRIWAQTTRPSSSDGNHFHGQLRQAFELAGIPDTHLAFDRFMTFFLVSLKNPVSFHFPRCFGVSEDEVMFIRLVAHMQQNEEHAIRAQLSRALKPGAHRQVMPPLAEIADGLAEKGMLLRPFSGVGRPSRPENARSVVHTAATANTVH